MKTSLIILALIMSVSFALQIKLEEEQHQRTNHRTIHHLNKVKVVGQNTTPDAEDPELIDTQLIIPAQFGSSTQRLVLDVTSYITWVQSSNPNVADSRCDGCPTETTPYVCAAPCKVDESQVQPKLAQSFDRRVNDDYFIGTLQKQTTQIGNLKISDFKIGLVSKLRQSDAQVLPNRGVLGLGFGKTYQRYYVGRQAQVDKVAEVLAQSENLNFLYLLSTQNLKLIKEPLIAVKLEQDLKLVTFGEADRYFTSSPLVNYDNQGELGWNLKLTEFRYGAFEDGTKFLQFHKEPGVSRQSQTAGLLTSDNTATTTFSANFDLTTKFITIPEAFVTKLIRTLNSQGNQCEAPTSGSHDLVECACASAKDTSKFLPLSFRFNQRKEIYRISSKNYVTFLTNKCYLGIKLAKSTDTELVTLGQGFFYENYVVFDHRANEIRLAKSYDVQPSAIAIKKNSRIGIIAAGIVLLLGSLIALLATLKQIKSIPEPQITQSRAAYVAPQPVQISPTYVYAQPQPQSYVISQAQPQLVQTYSVNPQIQGSTQFGAPVLSNRSRYIPGGQPGYIR